MYIGEWGEFSALVIMILMSVFPGEVIQPTVLVTTESREKLAKRLYSRNKIRSELSFVIRNRSIWCIA